MSARISLYTTSLTIRDVFCLNSNAAVIQPISIPVPGVNGKIHWLSSVEFLSIISVPTTSTSLLNFLTEVGPSLSTISRMVGLSTPIIVNSTIAGLGSIPNGNDYLSSSALVYKFKSLATDYGYVSTTMLGSTIDGLGTYRYVSTVNPGNYRIYKSSLGLQGTNTTATMANGATIISGTIGLGGFTTKVVTTSQMRIDVNANIILGYPISPALTTFSTILVNTANSQIVGNPVSLTYNAKDTLIANLSFMLNYTQLTPFPNNLQLHHVLNTGDQLNVTTNIPQIGGIFVTLDNTD